MELVKQVLGMTFEWGALTGLIVGTVGGIIIGVLPGFSASMGVALLIPITYGMSPVAGLIMLTAVYTSAIYGGSITATLCHTPGTPASAATAIDGYKLTQQGRGMEAVGVCTVASMIGGVVGALALLFLSPPLGKFSLQFSALEYCMLAIFGVTIIASLAGESLYKGLFSGILGLFLGTVGLDAITGTPRFTFGSIQLEDGIQFVPALIGMFSISQVMIIADDVFKGKHTIVDEKSMTGRILPPWNEFKELVPTIARSSVIGTIIGIIPAAGAGVSSWVCYSLGKKFSKHPEKFGSGSFEGVASSEAGNNAATGGALVPLITLALPGSAVAAILLGGMLMHGLVPGASMFTEKAPVTYTIIFGYLLSNILMGLIGLAIAKYVARVSTVPMGVLGPLVVALSAIGTYAIRNNMFDVFVMLAFGLLGYLLRRTGFATAPLVLGMVLGEIVESNWRRALIMSRGNMFKYFLSRPISLALLVLIALSMFTPVLMNYVDKKSRVQEKSA
ncbi:MAG: tripartite tricarboxylate transporter permease [Pyramidobacter porci]|uniref:tripartite tricarboxylate transporter permease n=1 Tax=Pyramidobacter porci TaxID=2605789 RepID=UPI002A7495AD|nr:tripartite tricarboxylate transporter permease [Pyramidobacter porci]MDY2648527.1 tripartite tricarboxylate transporter permease [Pyramidobacter porci]